MGIRLDEAGGFKDLMKHINHAITVVTYEHEGRVRNVALECLDCYEVLLDFDRPACTCNHSTFAGFHDLTCPYYEEKE
ncbi:MAG: hypothetical protein KAJ73_09010 [Zetaproteobacteria bacterium]|nr:hypothetical protein [Zetaproteobacteria bacterium]